jgi:hypothetical protein
MSPNSASTSFAGARIPNRLLLEQVPFIDDVDAAEELLDAEDEKNKAGFTDPFSGNGGNSAGDDPDGENTDDNASAGRTRE